MAMKIKLTVETGWANGDHVSYEELPIHWDSLTDKEKEDLVDEWAVSYMHEVVSCCGELVERGDDD